MCHNFGSKRDLPLWRGAKFLNKVGWRCGAVAILDRNVVSRCGAVRICEQSGLAFWRGGHFGS